MIESGPPERIYLDYASATPLVPEAAAVISQGLAQFANPGSIHRDGIEARDALAAAREVIAADLAVKPRELVFTSGGTESNNLAILGFARKLQLGGGSLSSTHWIVAAIEHPSVLECFGEIERLGGRVSFVDPDVHGIIRPEALGPLLHPETVFVSIGWANSETGVIQPLAELSRALRAHERQQGTIVIFHSDLGQAPVYKPPQVHTLGLDLATLDAGKLYGPRGIGALYIDNRVQLAPVMLGGGQERGLRAGTENVPLALGFAAAIEVIARERAAEAKRLAPLREALAAAIAAAVPGAIVNGASKHSLPHILNVSLPDVDTEYLTLVLDHKGIAVSTKSACREGGENRSHVIEAMCKKPEDLWRASHTLRFSFGRDSKPDDVRRATEALLHLSVSS